MVSYPHFGFDFSSRTYVDFRTIINDVLATVPKLSMVDAKMLLTDLYDRYTGISIPDGQPRPMATVAFHDAENYIDNGTMYDILMDFALSGYAEVWGISLTEYLKLPHWKAKMLRELTPKVNKIKSDRIQDAMNSSGS